MGFVKQVNCAPNESITWEKLTDPYIDLSQYEFTLNLCSMSTLDSRCMHHSLPAPKILLPSHRTNTELPEQETASVGHAENIGTSLCKRVRDPFKLRLGKRKQDRCCIWFDSRGFLTSDYRDVVGVVYGSAWGMRPSTCTPLVLISLNTHAGSSRVDNFPRWSGSFQDSACCVSQWNGTSRLYHGEGAKEAYQRCLDTARCVSSAFAAVIFRRYLSCIRLIYHRSRYSKIWTQRTIQTAIRVAVIMQSTLRWLCVLSFLVSCGFNLTLWSSIPVLLCGISFNSVSSMGPESDSCNAARLLFLPWCPAPNL